MRTSKRRRSAVGWIAGRDAARPGRSTPGWGLGAAAILSTACSGDITAVGCFGGPLPILVVYGIGGVGLLALIGWFAARRQQWSRLARAADGSVSDSGTLEEGPAVLRGSVCEQEASAPARVEIHQRGSESKDSSGNWTHRWREKNRRMFVRPFTMQLTSGDRILVEPTQRAILVDALDGVVRINRTARVLTAELTPGEALIASGRLERRSQPDGYRGSSETWVLTSPGRGQEMLLSTEPLGERFRSRMRGASLSIAFTLFGMLALQAIAGGFHLRLWAGVSEPARTVRVREWVTYDDDNNAHHHRELIAQLPDGTQFAEKIARTSHVADPYVRRVAVFPAASSFGRTATLHWLALVPHLFFPWLCLLLFRLWTPRHWYEGEPQSSRNGGRLR